MPHIDVIATSISGSIQDWQKVERIVPLFTSGGMSDIELQVADSHAEAREHAATAISRGGRTLISAGGSGTFNAVLEGIIDSGIPLGEIRLGFLRKGSADLIGKVLRMPDDVESAVDVFIDSIENELAVPCDVLRAESIGGEGRVRHFVGYGGAGLFGRIPHFTENRFMKWYKGVLSQFFGDLGPFTTGMGLAVIESIFKRPLKGRARWRITVDDTGSVEGDFHALIIVNGYLGKEMPYSKAQLGSGSFYLYAIEDRGLRSFFSQIKHARAGTIMDDPERWGMREFTISRSLEIARADGGAFPANVDGSTLACSTGLRIRIVDRLPLIAARDYQ